MKFRKTVTATLATVMLLGALSAPASTFASTVTRPVTTVTSTSTFHNASIITAQAVSSGISKPGNAIPIPIPTNGNKVEANNLISNVIKKAITTALRYGGNYLGQLLSKLSPKAGSFVTKYSGKIADFLDSITNWQENVIATGLVSIGIPPLEAYEIAKYIVFLAGL